MFISYQEFRENLERVRDQIRSAEAAAGRMEGSVTLLPVTKNHPVDAARYALEAGIASVGENRVQEALSKMDEADSSMKWELIGPLQSNKAKKVAERFHRVQTVDRLKVLKALQRHADDAGRALPVLLQINAGADPNKSGASVDEASMLLEAALEASRLEPQGLMTIAPLQDDPIVARRCFATLRQCRDRLESTFGIDLPELSMGMSGDLEAAILEGSTMVRVGTALYGARNYG
jgi:pyridoxal phosphate enzyme (YggS family)